MRKHAAIIAAIGLLAAPAAPAIEPFWERLEAADPTASIEIDRTSLERREGLLTVWLRVDFAEPARGRIKRFQSVLAQHAVDCAGRRHAAIRMISYSGALGDGEVIDRWDRSPEGWEWRTTGADPADAAILRIVCDQTPATLFSSAMTSSPP